MSEERKGTKFSPRTAFRSIQLASNEDASFLVWDKERVLYPTLGKALEGAGYEVKKLDLKNPSASDHFNPLQYVTDDNDVGAIVRTLAEDGSANPFFVDVERMMFAACIHYLKDLHQRPEDSHLIKVKEMIQEGQAETFRDRTVLDKLFDTCPPDSLTAKYYKAGVQASGREKANILAACFMNLQNILTPGMEAVITSDDMNLTDLGQKKMAIFILPPDPGSRTLAIAKMLYNAVNAQLEKAPPIHSILNIVA